MYKVCGAHFFCCRSEKPFLGKSSQKNQYCQFKLKFGIKTNLNMLNSMMMLTISFFDWKYLFEEICSKKSKLSVSADILRLTNLNMQNYVENEKCSLFLF